jgi:hypothetical protein
MLEENTEMFKHPRRFGIEVARQSHRESLLWRQEFPWKELSMGEKEFSEKQSSFRKKMARIENQFIVTRFCSGTRMDNRFFINALFVFYRAYKWLGEKRAPFFYLAYAFFRKLMLTKEKVLYWKR